LTGTSGATEADGAGLPAFQRTARAEEENLPPRLRGLITRLLRIGVGATALLMIAGLLLLFAHGSGVGAAPRLDGQNLGARFVAGDPQAILYAGVVVLLATPLVRVALSAGLFARAGDRAFAGITLVVLALLAVSILVGSVVR
jgi:uncharacterized membrane protein